MAKQKDLPCCPPKPKLGDRQLLSGPQAQALEGTFKMLGNATRLRLLHALIRAGELCVSDIAGELEMKPQAVSNQLQRLADRGIVESRRNGIQVYYRVIDPCVVSLLDQGWCLTEDASSRIASETEPRKAVS